MKAPGSIKTAVVVGVMLALSACGYYNPYAVGKTAKPVMLYRSMWTNPTTELGLENILFQAQSDWLRKSKLITLGDSPDSADYEVSGEIVRVNTPEISFGQFEVATQSRAELAVHYTITNKKTGKVVLNRSATRLQSYAMSQDPLRLQSNRRAALEKIADSFGEEIYLYLTNTILRPDTPATVEEVNEDIIQE